MPLFIPVSGSASEPSDFQPAIVDGSFYLSQLGTVNPSGQPGNSVNGYLTAIPVWFSQTITWTRIGISVSSTGAAASVYRLGIYHSSGNAPGALLLDAGTVPLDSTGDHEITISQQLQANTLYWLAGWGNDSGGTATLSTHEELCSSSSVTRTKLAWLLGLSDISVFMAGNNFIPARDGAYGALPNPFGADEVTGSAPAIWLRKV